ncbi:GNAT family protein [Brachybacterium sacelli]|uniref:GNAT family N-acetyltransferase n=1 Tax=Brachybacterium sacelli TaxID=173364 RepID=UPI00315A5ED6
MPPGSLSISAQPILAAGAFRLRPWRLTDVAGLVSVYAESDIQRWHARSMTEVEAARWVERAGSAWAEETEASWAVEVRGALAGRMTLKLDLTEGCASTAYWTRADYRGSGLAPRALVVASDWAFSIGMRRVELEHSTRNSASCRVASKAGFVAEGIRRDGALHADGWHDMHVHSRLARERPVQ